MSLQNMYISVSTTRIKIQNISIIPERSLWSFPVSSIPNGNLYPDFYHYSSVLPAPEFYINRFIQCLASFTQFHVFEIHPCSCVYHVKDKTQSETELTKTVYSFTLGKEIHLSSLLFQQRLRCIGRESKFHGARIGNIETVPDWQVFY